jgi:secreted trypsin-like serine protease
MEPVTEKVCFGFGDGISNCEISSNCPEGIGLIVGGEKANPAQFPHMAAIGWRGNEGNEFKCGGSLISEKFVITAAHCILGSSK